MSNKIGQKGLNLINFPNAKFKEYKPIKE